MKTTKFLLIASILFAFRVFPADLPKIPGELRNQYLERGQIWHPTPVSKMNILSGPRSKIRVPFGTKVTCKYEEPKEPTGGVTPKFKCRLLSGETVRIKYDSREVNAEVAASRLLWALGFYADNDYFVDIRCLGCPEKNPAHPEKDEVRVTKLIPSALMEENFPGVMIEKSEDQGWKWRELANVKQDLGGAPLAQIDALKLLGVFIQHCDSKADNQRLACYKQDLIVKGGVAECKKPVLMIADLGSTFGSTTGFLGHTGKMVYSEWKAVEIWNVTEEHNYLEKNHQQICIGNLPRSIGAGFEALEDPAISEEGRKFLAGLLNQLTLKQIKDLFRGAGVERLNEDIEENGVKRKVSIEDWTALFIKKRDQINERVCPSATPQKSGS